MGTKARVDLDRGDLVHPTMTEGESELLIKRLADNTIALGMILERQRKLEEKIFGSQASPPSGGTTSGVEPESFIARCTMYLDQQGNILSDLRDSLQHLETF